MHDDDEPTTETLQAQQSELETAERERVAQATTPGEARSAQRRADKAAYLRSKLGEQARNPDEE
jgi:hypothetical protein